LRALILELGLLNALLYVSHRLLSAMSGGACGLFVYELVIQPVARDARLAPHLRRDLDVRRLSGNDARGLGAASDPREIETRLVRGDVCVAAFMSGKLAGYHWVCHGEFEETDIRCCLAPEPRGITVWDYDLFVQPQYRVGVLFTGLWDEMNAYLHKQGCQWTASLISGFNKASLNAHLRLGARRRAKLVFIKFFVWQVYVGTIAPFIYLSISPRAKPRITVVSPSQ
jgi:GNAT superfamily N-acetyltransferase